jgi:peptide/bleomycin uptake transporter
MFRYFYKIEWLPWSIGGSFLIVFLLWLQAYLATKINVWYGEFYDVLGDILAGKAKLSEVEFYLYLLNFLQLAGISMFVSVFLAFFSSHWSFRWRTSMIEFYHSHYNLARNMEGASQRVQEDCLKFARMLESLGVGLAESIFYLIFFLPILYDLSKSVKYLPFFGEVEHSMVWVAVVFSLFGTVLLAVTGIRLPGLEYKIQVEEARYRKELVLGEDDIRYATPDVLNEKYDGVRKIHYRNYLAYLWFNVVKYGYLQGMVLIPYIALGPSIMGGFLTLGSINQIVNAFKQVETSLQYILRSWGLIVEFVSVYKRLREFEEKIKNFDRMNSKITS